MEIIWKPCNSPHMTKVQIAALTAPSFDKSACRWSCCYCPSTNWWNPILWANMLLQSSSADNLFNPNSSHHLSNAPVKKNLGTNHSCECEEIVHGCLEISGNPIIRAPCIYCCKCKRLAQDPSHATWFPCLGRLESPWEMNALCHTARRFCVPDIISCAARNAPFLVPSFFSRICLQIPDKSSQ